MRHRVIAVAAFLGAAATIAGACGSGTALRLEAPAATTAAAESAGIEADSEPSVTTADTAPPQTTRPVDAIDVVPSTEAVTTTTYVPVEGPRLAWEGQGLYLHGANLPWYNWACDFGCGADGGVSSTEVGSEIDAVLGEAKAAGMSVVRWWVFPGEPLQIEVDAAGLPSGIDDAVYQDFDAALALAEVHDISYVFTLFSGPSALPSPWLESEVGRGRLATALGELFARYRDNARIHTWQVMNEPEWEIWNGVVDENNVRELVVEVVQSIHLNSAAFASVGAARLDGLPMWLGAGLDYYTAHWYDPMGTGEWCAICTDYPALRDRYDLDAPLVIGEFFAGAEIGAEARFAELHDRGYAGAWAWSLLPERTIDNLAVDLQGAAAFASEHADLAS